MREDDFTSIRDCVQASKKSYGYLQPCQFNHDPFLFFGDCLPFSGGQILLYTRPFIHTKITGHCEGSAPHMFSPKKPKQSSPEGYGTIIYSKNCTYISIRLHFISFSFAHFILTNKITEPSDTIENVKQKIQDSRYCLA